MDNIPRMSRLTRRHLIRLGRRSGEPQTAVRFHIVSRLGLGRSSPQVAEEVDVARSTVVRAAAHFVADGVAGLYDKRRGNGAAKVDDAFCRALATLLRRTPEDFGWMRPTWTRVALPPDAARRLARRRSMHDGSRACACRRAARYAEAHRALPVAARCAEARSCRHSPPRRARQRRRAGVVLRRGRRPPQPEDPLNPKIGRDWMLRGHQRRIVTPGKNKKFYLAGALDVRTGRLHTTGADRKNAALFCQLLWLLASRYRRARRVHLVVDNYGIHSAHLTRDTLATLGGRIVLHFLPPYCPDANRIERVWQDFHANVTRNHRCKTMNHLLANARRYLDSYRWRRGAALSVARRAA